MTPTRLIDMSPMQNDIPWLTASQSERMTVVKNSGLPTRRDEDWKYSDPRAIRDTSFVMASSALETGAFKPAMADATNIVLDNGFLVAGAALPAGVSVTALSDIVGTSHEALLRDAMAAASTSANELTSANDAFARLNDGLFAGGAVIHITKTQSTPVYLSSLLSTANAEAPVACFPKVLVVVDDNVEATIIEDHSSAPNATGVMNTTTHLRLAKNAKLRHHVILNMNKDSSLVHEVDSVVRAEASHSISAVHLGAGYHRSMTKVALREPKAMTSFDGLMIGDGKSHMDTHSVFDHEVPDCESSQLVKSIMAGHSRGVFNGKVIFQKDAQRSVTAQENHNLLLSRDAEIDAKPELEIYADDVKASHGSTIGQLDEKALFYLRSRGISENEASQMLMEAFAGEIVERYEDEAIADVMGPRIKGRLAEVLSAAGKTSSK